MGLSLVAPPALDPVTLMEAKAQGNIDLDIQDGLIAGYLLAARQYVEVHTRRALMTQTWDYLIDACWPICKVGGVARTRITLPLPPVQSVASVKYFDLEGTEQTLSADQYRVSLKRHEAIIEPAYGVIWPSVRDQSETITVRFDCGYGSNPGDVPEPIRQAILMLVAFWCENRETVNVGNIVNELPFSVEALLFPYRVFY